MSDPLHPGPLFQGQAVPTLPARDLEESLAFYAQLGFTVAARYTAFGGPYAVLRQGGLELHLFQRTGFDPARNDAGCFLRVGDAAGLHATLHARSVQGLGALKDRPWGVREFALVDPSGNLLRIGQPLRAL